MHLNNRKEKGELMKEKNILIIVIIVLLIIFLFPIKVNRLKDGGTVEYKALTYKISNVHRYSETEHEDGIIVEILGKEIFNNVIAKHIERDVYIGTKDLKLTDVI